MKLEEQKTLFDYRARQNVILELGFFMGFLGRRRVCCLYKEGVELPSNILGIVYKKFKENLSENSLGNQKGIEGCRLSGLESHHISGHTC